MAAVAKEAVQPLLPQNNLAALNDAAAKLSRDQLLWASGYLAGLAAIDEAQPTQAPTAPAQQQHPATDQWTILYATETGNSRRVAEKLEAEAQAAGLATRLIDIADYPPKELKNETRLLIVTATHGLGDPPEGCEPFFEFLHGKRAPQLPNLKYSVLALGDSSYEDFCTAGLVLDERFEALGAERLTPRVDCDVDYEDDAARWSTETVETAASLVTPAETAITPQPRLVAVASAAAHDRDHPFEAEIFANQKITGRQSSKDVRHVELSLEGSGLQYQPGDSLGVWPTNSARLVNQVLEQFNLNGEQQVTVGKDTLPLHRALSHRLELSQVSGSLLKAYAEIGGPSAVDALLEDRGALTKYLNTHQVIDLLVEYPTQLTEQQLATTLRRITPRLYSIASSPLSSEDEVHLTVGLLDTGNGRFGTTSELLAREPDALSVYVEPNKHFRLPADDDTSIIMIGPGTGVAPFRAFVEHRQLLGASGRSWLFFGDRNFSSDFLYQIEWLRHLKQGTLSRLDLAFSRDQAHKIYVQDRLRERSDELFAWMEAGAHVYVCGDLKFMAPDVHQALVDIAARGLGKDSESGEAYLKQLKAAGRYQRDVY